MPRSCRGFRLLVFATGLTVAAKSEKARLAVPGGALEYEVAGRGRPVILIHGGLVDRRMWDGQMPWLAAKYRVVRYDLRGLGRSSDITAAYSPVEDLVRLMDHLRIRKATLVGLSLGGMVAMDFALENPNRVETLVLCAPGLRGVPANPREELKAAYRALFANAPDGIDKLLDTGFGAVTPEARSRMRLMLNDNVQRAIRADQKQVQWPQPATANRLEHIKAPTLLFIGTADEPDLIAIADLLSRKIPSIAKIVLPGAAHHVNLDAPEQFEMRLRAFLASPRLQK